MIFNLPNPIPATVADQQDLQDFYRRYEVIPQFGTTEKSGMAFLDLLQTLTDLSPTFNAVLRDLKAYTFGLNIDMTAASIPGLRIDAQDATDQQKIDYANYLAGLGIDLQNIIKLSKRIKHHLAASGNAYLKITRVVAGTSARYIFEVPFYTNCAYLRSRDEGAKFILISPWIGNEQMLQQNPPEILQATQAGEMINWNAAGRGTWKAIVHIKADTDEEESPYYARPDIIHIMPALYIDWQIDNLNSKIAATELVSKKIIAFMAPDPNTLDSGADFDDVVDQDDILKAKIGKKTPFKAAMAELKAMSTNLSVHPSKTNTGAASAFVGIQYPFSAEPPTTIDLEMNRDTKHQTWQLDTAVRRICSALGWAPELTMMIQARATLGGNMLRDILVQREISTIAPDQVTFSNLWNGIFAQIKVIENAPAQFGAMGIKYPRVVHELIEQLSNTPQAPTPDISAADQNDQNDNQDGNRDNM